MILGEVMYQDMIGDDLHEPGYRVDLLRVIFPG